MYKSSLIRNIDYKIHENGHIYINNIKISSRDASLLSYYLIKTGEFVKIKPFIKKVAMKIESGQISLFDNALWLWILGEYSNKTGEFDCAQKYESIIEICLDRFEKGYKKPQKSWTGQLEEDVYISNIAAIHGGVNSINNVIKSDRAKKLLKELREFLFRNFLVGGRVVSGIVNKEVMGDISIISVPFGLLDAGNQIMVESVSCLEGSLVDNGVRLSIKDGFFGGCIRNDLTCFLSWYYSEKGDLSRAKWLLSKVSEVWEKENKLTEVVKQSAKEKELQEYYLENKPGQLKESYLSYILYAITELNIREKELSGAKSTSKVDIIHNHEGTGNRYLTENIQRIPIYPLENECVSLRMVTQPLSYVNKAYVSYCVNDIEQPKLEMKLDTDSEGEKYWECNIGSFAYKDTVKYKFIAATQDDEIESSEYEFKTREWLPIGESIHVIEQGDKLILYFLQALNGQIPSLDISEVNDSTIKMSFAMEKQTDKIVFDSVYSKDINLGSNVIHIDFRDSGLNLKINSDNLIQSFDKLGKSFIELLTDGSGKVYKVRSNLMIDNTERFFGMGERYSTIEYRGSEIDTYVFNQYTNQKLRTYIPVPFTISCKGYGIFLDTPMYSKFKFGTSLTNLLEIETDISKSNQSSDSYIFIGSPKNVLENYTDICGKPILPPKWAFGPWMSSNNWDSQQETLKQLSLTNKHEIPSTVIVLEQWSDEATFYIFNDASYEVKDANKRFKYEDFTYPEWGRWPNPKSMIEQIHKSGIKVLLWQSPFERYMDGIAHEQRDNDEEYMIKSGYCVRTVNGHPYRVPSYGWFKRSVIPDFSNPKAKKWWLSKRRYLLEDLKIDGFKTDGGECIFGEDLKFYDGRTGAEMRNQFPNDYISSFYDFANEYVEGGAITFSRAGYTGAQKTPLHWAGDESSTFDAFKASVNAGLSCSISGIPFWGWDLAGFHGEIPTAELFIRSTQFAAFCPVMQYHAETKGELNRDRTPWNIAERTNNTSVIELYKKYADLRMNILPYIYEQAKISSCTGIPLMRSMFFQYPADENCTDLADQYFFGNSLLVAPIMEESQSRRKVYLPLGKWLDLFSGDEYAGEDHITIKCDIDKIPVFVKENGIIPLNLSDDLTLFSHVGNEVYEYKNLCFMMYISEQFSYEFIDESSNKISIEAEKDFGSINIEVKGTAKIPIHLIIANPNEDIDSIKINNNVLDQVADKNCLASGTYCVQDNKLFIMT